MTPFILFFHCYLLLVFDKYFILSIISIAVLLENIRVILLIHVRAYQYYTQWTFQEIKM